MNLKEENTELKNEVRNLRKILGGRLQIARKMVVEKVMLKMQLNGGSKNILRWFFLALFTLIVVVYVLM